MTRRFQNLNNWHVFYILVLITFFTSLTSGIINPDKADMAWWSGFLQNFSTEMMGAIATFALFEVVVGSRNEKNNLIIQMGSSDNATAVTAVEQLRASGWLQDGSLQGLSLPQANLQSAILRQANLEGANLRQAHLEGANLIEAHLEGAILNSAHLEGANLSLAHLEGTDLRHANLEGADLTWAYLEGADLAWANLQGANLRRAKLDDVTWAKEDGTAPAILPDGTEWTSYSDMECFTNFEHSDFQSKLDEINTIREMQGRDHLIIIAFGD